MTFTITYQQNKHFFMLLDWFFWLNLSILPLKVQFKLVFQDPSARHRKKSEPCWSYPEEHVICIPLVIPMPSHSFTFSIEKASFEGIPQSVYQILNIHFRYNCMYFLATFKKVNRTYCINWKHLVFSIFKITFYFDLNSIIS